MPLAPNSDNSIRVGLNYVTPAGVTTYVNDATVTAQLYLLDGITTVGSQATLSYVAASNGNYYGEFPEATPLTNQTQYLCWVVADAGAGYHREFWLQDVADWGCYMTLDTALNTDPDEFSDRQLMDAMAAIGEAKRLARCRLDWVPILAIADDQRVIPPNGLTAAHGRLVRDIRPLNIALAGIERTLIERQSRPKEKSRVSG